MLDGIVTSRRTVVGGALAMVAGGALLSATNGLRVAAQASPAATPGSPLSPDLPTGGMQADGTWAFTDDLGNVITADTTPTKVVAHVGIAAALFDVGFEVVGYYNPATDAEGNRLPIAGDLPLDRLTHLGDYDELDLEQLVALRPDLFIGQNYGVKTGGMWPFSDDVLAQIGEIVPVVYLAYGDDVTVVRNIETIENLATALGANTDAPALTESREAFRAASDALAAALASKPDLRTLFLSGSDTGFWVESAGGADTRYFRTLGMDIYPEEANGEVSWEQFLNYPADLIFVDDRAPNWWQPEQLAAEIPVWERHPAVIAGQVAPWRAQFISSYAGFTPILEEVVQWVKQVDDSIA
jgi:iron complex transport system substrate-binding protein